MVAILASHHVAPAEALFDFCSPKKEKLVGNIRICAALRCESEARLSFLISVAFENFRGHHSRTSSSSLKSKLMLLTCAPSVSSEDRTNVPIQGSAGYRSRRMQSANTPSIAKRA